MDKQKRYLMAAVVTALAGIFSMTVRGPEHAVFLFLMAAFMFQRSQQPA